MKRKSRACSILVVAILALAVVLLFALPGAGATDGRSTGKAEPGRTTLTSQWTSLPYRPGEVIVKFKNGIEDPLKNEVKGLAGASNTLSTIGPKRSDQAQLLKLDPGVQVEQAVASLRASDRVAYAEPNYIARASYTPNDPSFTSEWGLNNTGQTINGVAGTADADIDAPQAWNIERGLEVPPTVAVIDSGIDSGHPDLNAKVLTGYNWAGISQLYSSQSGWMFGYSSSTQKLAQSIKGTGQKLTHIGIALAKNGSPSAGIKVSVRSSLGGSDLASYSISPSEVPSSVNEVYKKLSSSVTLSNGTTYYLMFQTSNLNASNYYLLADNWSLSAYYVYNVYSEGHEYQFDGSSWLQYSTDDFFFQTNPNANPHDDFGHGTHVSGIIGAETNNATGIAGVCPGAKIMPLKVLDSSNSAYTSDINSAIYYAADHGARIINMSLGGTGFSQSEQDAINYAYNKGVVVFASSGNTGDSTMNYPAGCSHVIGVGATTNLDQIAGFSTYNSSVDVSAPGKDVYSTMPRYAVGLNDLGYTQNYSLMSGTSMACPMAAGLGALVVSRSPTRTPAQVQQLIQAYADDLGTHGRDNYFGYGRINAFRTLSHEAATPGITSISTTSGYVGTTVTINGGRFGSSRGTSYVKFGKTTCASGDYRSWGASQVKVKVPAGTALGAQKVSLTTASGISNTKTFTVKASPGSPTWYLAEGTTDYGFDCYITIENPNTTSVTADITYMTGSGPVTAPSVSLPAMSQATVNPRDVLGNKDFSTKVSCKEGKQIAVDRTMSWTGPGAASPEAHSSIGVTSPSKTWYLPEGSSKWGFECWLLIQNPNTGAANCIVTYMIEGQGPKTVTKTVPANSRKTFFIADDIGQADASIKVEGNIPVIPERAMYRNNRREGHDSIGTTSPAKDFYLAEGTSAYGFTTYVLIQNPNSTPTDVTVTYMTGAGPKPQAPFTMDANSRKTIRVNDVSGMGSVDFSTQVHGSKPIIAERAMYWDNGTGEACHDSVGMDKAHTSFYLPDGQTSDGRETYTLVQNPNSSPVTVEISYMTPNGAGNVVFTDSIPANSRKTYNMADKGIGGRAAIMVTSKTAGKKIMCERAMYWNARGAGTDTIGGFSD